MQRHRFFSKLAVLGIGIVVLQFFLLTNSMGQPPFVPCRVPTQQAFEMMPAQLKKLVEIRQ